MSYVLIFISAVFVNNIVLSQFLGICPFLGVSKKIDTALGMAGAVAFVMTIAPAIPRAVWRHIKTRKKAIDKGMKNTDKGI